MPVTTYQPVAACGPCGGATTVMRPVTTYALRPQLVPYTTYRPVVTSVVAAYAPVAQACSPCGGAVGVPLVPSQMATSALSPFAPSVAGPCAGCAAGPPASTYINPGMPGNSVPSLGLPNINAPPSLNGAPGQPLRAIPSIQHDLPSSRGKHDHRPSVGQLCGSARRDLLKPAGRGHDQRINHSRRHRSRLCRLGQSVRQRCAGISLTPAQSFPTLHRRQPALSLKPLLAPTDPTASATQRAARMTPRRNRRTAAWTARRPTCNNQGSWIRKIA